MGLDLFGGEDESEDFEKIEIDEDYAEHYKRSKEKQHLRQLEDKKKRGELPHSSSDSESESDASDTDLVGSRAFDIQYYDALSKVKKQAPELSQKDLKLFSSESSDEEQSENEEEVKKPKKKKKEKPVYLKDVNAKHLLDQGPEFGEGEDGKLPKNYDSKGIYNEEQAENVKAFLDAEKEAFGGSDDEDIFKEKENGGENGAESEDDEVKKKLDDCFGEDDKLDENDAFLKSFFMNKMWIDKNKEKMVVDDKIDVSEDEDELEKQDRYEAEYNFRHEEAGVTEGGDRVWGHSRVIEGSVRKKDSSRKMQRKSKEERMALAERERREEVKHLKNLKKKEIQEKLEKIRSIAGMGENDTVKLDEEDLEEEFDPEVYDKKMRAVFDDSYYGAEDADPGFGSDNEEDIEKPDFDKEDELLGLPKGWDVGTSHDGFEAVRERLLKQNGDVVDEEEEDEDGGSRKEDGKRKRKRKISLREKAQLDKEFEEYYKLDYEDTIGDLKTRFKYRSVRANRYGLRTEEILTTNDKELNQYVSLKKLAPYRDNEWRMTHHQKMKKNMILRGNKPEHKKKYKKHEPDGDSGSIEHAEKQQPKELKGEETNNVSKKSRRKHRQAELKLSKSRMMAYGKILSRSSKKY